jgi:hypothetical protein
VPPPPSINIEKKISVIQDDFQSVPHVLAGSKGYQFIVSYKREVEPDVFLDFRAVQDSLPVIMQDNEGNYWDIFGTAVSGQRTGEKLIQTYSFTGYWFAFGTMYPGMEIFSRGAIDVDIDQTPAPEWLIPTDFVFQGAGRDAIPSLDVPAFIHAVETETEMFFVDDDDLIIGISSGDHQRSYPHKILDWHEIVNDQIDDEVFSVIYCPLTGTGTIWNRVFDGGLNTFGVSGLLYNSNIIPYDRETESLWTQIDEKCINGSLIGEKPERLRFIETSWYTWSSMFPESDVLSDQTGFDRNYSVYPYGDYKTNHNFIGFPISYNDDRLPSKERVHCIIIDGQAKAYRFASFD